MSTEYERCEAMSDRELMAYIEEVIPAPAIQVLLKRIEVKPEEPGKPDKPGKLCDYCGGMGLGLMSRKTCPNCKGTGVKPD